MISFPTISYNFLYPCVFKSQTIILNELCLKFPRLPVKTVLVKISTNKVFKTFYFSNVPKTKPPERYMRSRISDKKDCF